MKISLYIIKIVEAISQILCEVMKQSAKIFPKVSDALQSQPNIIFNDFYEHINLLLFFKESKHERSFESIFRDSSSNLSIFITQTVCSVYFICATVSSFSNNNSVSSFVLYILSAVFIGVSGWVLIILQGMGKQIIPLSQLIKTSWMFAIIVLYSLSVALRASNEQCNSSSLLYRFNCTSQAGREMAEGEMCLSMILPTLIPLMVNKGFKYKYQLSSWALCVFINGFALFYFDKRDSLLVFLCFAPVSFSLLYVTRAQSLAIFLLSERQRDLLERNSQMAMDDHVTEMRHLIGNMAHDLKTPLSGITSGIEMLSSLAQDIQTMLLSMQLSSASTEPSSSDSQMVQRVVKLDEMQSSVESVISTADSITHINAFMLMTINRCIDFTKITNGLKLVPRFETVNLLETLSLPLTCMSDMQSRIRVLLQPIDSAICSHVITDKQWLQENVLCLLSNAVKYSNEGEVTVTVTYVDGSAAECVADSPPQSNKLIPPLGCSRSTAHSAILSVRSEELSCRPVLLSAERGLIARNSLCVEVEDRGIGLSTQAMTDLFTPFNQAQRLAGGTGLGLYALAKRIEALDGTYGVQHRRDGQHGSLFWFTIPYKPDNGAASRQPSCISSTHLTARPSGEQLHLLAEKQPSLRDCVLDFNTNTNTNTTTMMSAGLSPRSATTAPASPPATVAVIQDLSPSPPLPLKLNILLVDDSPTIIKMSSQLLRRHGHTVTAADNGATAMTILTAGSDCNSALSTQFDVILMDLQMPVMDGLEATARIRALEQLRSTPDTEESDDESVQVSIASVFSGQKRRENISPAHRQSEADGGVVGAAAPVTAGIVSSPRSSRHGSEDHRLSGGRNSETRVSFHRVQRPSDSSQLSGSSRPSRLSGASTSDASCKQSKKHQLPTQQHRGSFAEVEAVSYVRDVVLVDVSNTPSPVSANTRKSLAMLRGRTKSDANEVITEIPVMEKEQVEQSRHQFIIGVSANSDHDTMTAAFSAGVDAFIPKPFKYEVFLHTYHTLLLETKGKEMTGR